MSNQSRRTRPNFKKSSKFSDLVIKTAKQISNPLIDLKLPTKYQENGLNLTVSFKVSGKIDQELHDWFVQLTTDNMKGLYENSEWGWDEEEKRLEFTDKEARFLIVKDSEDKLQAFVHFRFDTDFAMPVLYCYEIQLIKSVQKNGLGRFLMHVLELMAIELKLSKVILTVFKHNQDAMDFYSKGLKFHVDKSSPSVSTKEDVCYEILSKSCK